MLGLPFYRLLFPNGRGYRFFSSNSDLKLSPLQQDVLIGGLLGDLSVLQTKPTHNARLSVRHSTEQTSYTMHLFFVFKSLCTLIHTPTVGHCLGQWK
jgi:hypothetical protein